jgi:hypothetical protein
VTVPGVVDAYKIWEMLLVPIIVRLQGTNAAIAKELIDNSGMPILSAVESKSKLTKSGSFLIIEIDIKNPVRHGGIFLFYTILFIPIAHKLVLFFQVSFRFFPRY